MRLITEENNDIQYITEGEGANKKLYIQGIFAQADVVNRNKRLYPLAILENEVNRFVKENINTGSAIGELNHPSGPSVNLDRSCILIKELKKDGSNFLGKAAVLGTPMGKIAQNLIEGGARLGVSTRALGTLHPWSQDKNVNEVGDDLRLLTIDVVGDPSAHEAFVNGIMEGAEWVYNATTGIYQEAKIEQITKKVKKTSIKQLEERKFVLFERFLKSLES